MADFKKKAKAWVKANYPGDQWTQLERTIAEASYMAGLNDKEE